MFWSQVVGNHVYIFHNGDMIYKKWVDSTQSSKIFDKGGLPPFDLNDRSTKFDLNDRSTK